jgi:hypothetical protein
VKILPKHMPIIQAAGQLLLKGLGQNCWNPAGVKNTSSVEMLKPLKPWDVTRHNGEIMLRLFF